ncbi:MAG TPA: alkaline phosphatase family protein [Gemmatimonadales bacterium]|nr:alkaline phosphatase family protein [Gemmatimonadales bacterium]
MSRAQSTRCMLLLVDGLRRDVAEAELAAGALPHLARMVNEGGRACAITAFPSTTSVAYLPFLTGCTPGRCDVPSIRWLDRTRYDGRWWRGRAALRSYCGYQAPMLDGDIAPDVSTIFELVPGSVGLFTPVARGLGPAGDPTRVARKFWGTVSHYAQWHQPGDDAVARHLLVAADGPARFIFAQFPAVDGYTHQRGHDSAEVRRALGRVDATVGRLTERLRVRGELERTLILLVSDHGASPVRTHLDLADWFRARGVRTLAHPTVWVRDPQVAVMVAGNGSAMVYARPGVPRARRWPLAALRSVAFVAALLAEPAVDLVAAEEENGAVRVASQGGEAELWRREADGGVEIDYRPLTGDPLGIGGAWTASAREWLDATWDSPRPDAAYQLVDQFRSPRTGDLVVTARPGYDFRHRWEIPTHRAGHGSLTRDHMQTPLWANVPLPDGPFRTVDLFPAMLEWLGVPMAAAIDGDARWHPPRAADDADRATESARSDALVVSKPTGPWS